MFKYFKYDDENLRSKQKLAIADEALSKGDFYSARKIYEKLATGQNKEIAQTAEERLHVYKANIEPYLPSLLNNAKATLDNALVVRLTNK